MSCHCNFFFVPKLLLFYFLMMLAVWFCVVVVIISYVLLDDLFVVDVICYPYICKFLICIGNIFIIIFLDLMPKWLSLLLFLWRYVNVMVLITICNNCISVLTCLFHSCCCLSFFFHFCFWVDLDYGISFCHVDFSVVCWLFVLSLPVIITSECKIKWIF